MEQLSLQASAIVSVREEIFEKNEQKKKKIKSGRGGTKNVLSEDRGDYYYQGSEEPVRGKRGKNWQRVCLDAVSSYRQQYEFNCSPKHNTSRQWGRRVSGISKEVFVHSSCQFVVLDSTDHIIHSIDPDKIVEWQDVQLVRFPAFEPVCCPICLEETSVPKMTRCGHVFCWAHILRHLAYADSSYGRCPVCQAMITSTELKSVHFIYQKRFLPGDMIKMKLMRKTKGSACAAPIDSWSELQAKDMRPVNVSDCSDLVLFAKVLEASKLFFMEMVGAEKCGLREQLNRDEAFNANLLEVVSGRQREEILTDVELQKGCIISALAELKARLCMLEAVLEVPIRKDLIVDTSFPEANLRARKPSESSSSGLSSIGTSLSLSETATSLCSLTSDIPSSRTSFDETSSMDSNLTKNLTVSLEETALELEMPPGLNERDNLKKPNASCRVTNADRETSRYFYQSADGQLLFLHSINGRCLTEEFGHLSLCPPIIDASIVAMEEYVVTEELRRRLRYLAHLPLHAVFYAVELQLEYPIVSKGTLQKHASVIESRRQQRLVRQRAEKLSAQRDQEKQQKYWKSLQKNLLHSLTTERGKQQAGIQDTKAFPSLGETFPDRDERGSDVSGTRTFAQIMRNASSTPCFSALPRVATISAVPKVTAEDDLPVAPDFRTSFLEGFSAAESPCVDADEHNNNALVKGRKGRKKKGHVFFSTGGMSYTR